MPKLFGEKAGLRRRGGCCCSRFAAGDAYDAENGDLGEGGAGDEDAVGGGVEVGRGDLHAVVQEREQVVGDDAFERVAVGEAETDPKAVEFGAAQEGFAVRLEVVGELADEIDRAHLDQGKLFVLAVAREEVDRFILAEARRVHIAADGFPVGKHHHDLLVRGGWGPILQRVRTSGTLICELL